MSKHLHLLLCLREHWVHLLDIPTNMHPGKNLSISKMSNFITMKPVASQLTSEHATPQISSFTFTSSSWILTAERLFPEPSSSSPSTSGKATSIVGGSPRREGPSLPPDVWLSLGSAKLFRMQYNRKDAWASWKASQVWHGELQEAAKHFHSAFLYSQLWAVHAHITKGL